MGKFSISAILVVCFVTVFSDENPYKHVVKLHTEENFVLEWLAEWETGQIFFNVTVKTTGYVGFGVSIRGEVAGADIIIGGVNEAGQPYFTDRHGKDIQRVEIDSNQDWTLYEAWERNCTTFLSFSRPFDTCDSQDLPITDDLFTIIWDYGETDDYDATQNFNSRGNFPAYLLDPDLTPRSVDDRVPASSKGMPLTDDGSTKIFNISKTIIMPAQETMYWCSFHKVPTTSKHHIIGFNQVFPTEKDKEHVHHFLLYRCHPPEGVDPATLFDTQSEGEECYFIRDPNSFNTQYCTEDIHVFAVGARPNFFPEHAGIPMSASGPEYFLLQTHYDNPNLEPNLEINFSLEAYYTSNLRENDAGMITFGVITPGSTSIIVPPNSKAHEVVGHCAPGCTAQMFPEEGINVFAAFLHTHISGRASKYHHFRDGQELPYIMKDDNFDFNYQQYRVLKEERKIMPGDLLINQCTYDITFRNGSAVVGGFSTRQEMCTAFLWYYARSLTHAFCRSELKTNEYLDLIGVRTTRWNPERRAMVITSPSQYEGISMADYATNHIKWDSEMREEIQNRHIFDEHATQCPSFTPDAVPSQAILQTEGAPAGVSTNPNQQPVSSFPTNIPRYEPPPSQCRRNSNRGGRGWSRN